MDLKLFYSGTRDRIVCPLVPSCCDALFSAWGGVEGALGPLKRVQPTSALAPHVIVLFMR